jgi:hypothetical protein
MRTLQLPKKLDVKGYKGPERQAINELIDAVRRLQPIAGKGIELNETSNGVGVAIDPNATLDGTDNLPRWL